MKTYRIPNTDLTVSRLAYGCMKIGGSWDHNPAGAETQQRAQAVVEAALDSGINFFDHADIYTCGKSETVFGHILKATPGLRDRIVLQSKVGIRFGGDAYLSGEPSRYDFSAAHIVRSVEAILRRLQTSHLDLLLLHRPDPLVEPAEVAQAFDELQASGKVRHFGVSNHTPAQIELLKQQLRQPLVINQLEFSLAQPALVSEGIHANQAGAGANAALATGILDYCRLNKIFVQAWSPVGGGKLLRPASEAAEATPPHPAATLVASLAAAKKTTREAILLAWILRHPAGIQPIIGSTQADRVRAGALADDVSLSREEWYSLLAAASGKKVP
jgi:predicted oxidoreductase